MRKSVVTLAGALCLLALSWGGPDASLMTRASAQTTTSGYVLLAWSELGMHCMDGKDYSVFAVLPPYNTVRAQLYKKGEPPAAIVGNVTLTYQAMADATGSINTSSANKTNFWTYVRTLFLAQPPPNVGLKSKAVQSTTPRTMDWNSTLKVWEAEGIPTVPYDNNGARNAYPMGQIVAKDASGKVLATATVVFAVSDEMSCNTCHASNTNAAAKPASGWENNADASKDTKLNILKKHDDRWPISQYLGALQSAGYTYQSSLYQTAKSGTAVLCAACHGTNALGLAGVSGVRPLTQDMHNLHASVVNPATGTSLDKATTPYASCYLCHPGQQTKCQRGAMSKTACYDCHGNLSKVGSGTRRGWLDLPACQMCHNSGTRYTSTFSSAGTWRTTSDTRFATNSNTPSTGLNLYRFSKGHGGAYCAGCHGSPHAEYPTLNANDNVYSTKLQGHAGTIAECQTCHAALPVSLSSGPHKIHTVGQAWVSGHEHYAEGGGYQQCAYCHGSDYRGSPLSKTSMARTFRVDDGRTKSFPAGHAVSCYDCHNGPYGD